MYNDGNEEGGDIMSNEISVDVDFSKSKKEKPRTVEVGETITIRANIKDDISGVKSVSVSFKNPSKRRTENISLSQKLTSNIWQGAYEIHPTDEPGKYEDFFISIKDNAGNKVHGWETLQDFRDQMVFYVENSQGGDINPPKVKGVEITPKSVKVGEMLSFKLDAEDDLAGVKSIAISFKNPSGSKKEHVFLQLIKFINGWNL
jgi:hypothetical protein